MYNEGLTVSVVRDPLPTPKYIFLMLHTHGGKEGGKTGRPKEHQELWNKGQALNFTLLHNSFLGTKT